MKKIVSCVFFLIAIILTGCSKSNVRKLKVYNWGDYMDRAVIKSFEKEYNVKVIYDEFSTNEDMYAKLKAGGINYDIVVPSEYMVEKMAKEGMLEKIDFSKLHNYDSVNGQFRKKEYNKSLEYSVPYMWGSVGIIYNKDMVKEKVDSWKVLWDKKYKKQILMLDSPRDSIGITLKLLGCSANSKDVHKLKLAKNMLIKQKPLVLSYVNEEVKDIVIGDEAALAVVWSGDAAYMKQHNPKLEYVIPKEGSNMWVDSMVIPKDAKNKDLALQFIDYMLRPDIAQKNCNYTGYLTSHAEIIDTLKSDSRNEMECPTEEEIDRLEIFRDLGKDISLYDRVWTEVKST
ncbi:MAG: spermidine/putrescine ABC transporter substrate-binding protein [Clostridiales bacterium]|nr:spermidine/putrescine ABC transporter substrate-binding protein [Clostridiales bacterium]